VETLVLDIVVTRRDLLEVVLFVGQYADVLGFTDGTFLDFGLYYRRNVVVGQGFFILLGVSSLALVVSVCRLLTHGGFVVECVVHTLDQLLLVVDGAVGGSSPRLREFLLGLEMNGRMMGFHFIETVFHIEIALLLGINTIHALFNVIFSLFVV
jgi:hypothetical protein